jgi:EAL domain-containing protein (putative c-di-GMP-specific phosphodiesterase class I)
MERDAINTILAAGGLSVVFQPIFDLDEDRPAVYAYEALCRGPKGTHFERAGVLFDYVRFKKQETPVDRRCIELAIAEGATLARSSFLSINVHALTIERDADLPRLIGEVTSRYGLDPSRIILELVEQSVYGANRKLLPALDRLRTMGIRIALDDVGLGHCNYKAILDVRPEVLKIDRYFVQNCAADPARQALLRSISSLACDFGATVVAEGIEQDDELATVRSANIRFGQGYLLGRPMQHVPPSARECGALQSAV